MSYDGPFPIIVKDGGTGAATLTGVVVGSGTSALTATGITQYNVLTGGASNAPNSVAPSATSGVPLISQGSSSQPAFGTAVVAGGGTGDTSFTAYAPICGGTTTTGVLQSASTGISTSGYILASTGSSSLPTFQSPGSVGSSWVLIQSQTATTSSSLAFTTGITSTYKNYVLVWSNITGSAATPGLYLQLSTNAGSSYISSGYVSGINYAAYNSSTYGNINITSAFYLCDTGSSYNASGTMWLYNMTSGVGYVTGVTNAVQYYSPGPTSTILSGISAYGTTSTTVNAFQILPSSGNITGTFSLFGLIQ